MLLASVIRRLSTSATFVQYAYRVSFVSVSEIAFFALMYALAQYFVPPFLYVPHAGPSSL